MNDFRAKIKVLYLDDEEVNLFIFRELFKDQLNVITTTSAEEALNFMRSPDEGIQIVITDLKMHPVNGMTFIFRSREEGFKLPICVLSAFPKTPEIENALNTGIISGFFSKPLDAELILKEAERLLSIHK